MGAFEDAAKEFSRAYELENKPTRLFNVGLAYEKAGLLQKASETYEQFLSLEREGSKAVEARARKLALDKQIATDEEAKSKAGARLAIEEDLQAINRAANEFLSGGNYERAAAEFEKAYQLGKDPEFLFDKAEALRLGSLAIEAVAAYRQYRRVAPEGINANEARQKQTELETSTLGLGPKQNATIDTKAALGPAKKESSVSWMRIGIGLGAIAAGLAADLIPGSASNNSFDALDIAPVALYGVGAGFVYTGVF